MKPFKLVFISLVMLLLMTNITPTFQHYAHADEANKKLKYSKNSALALNYHRVRKADPLNDFITIFSSSKEIKNYSVTSGEFESQIKWLKKHHTKFLTLKEFIKYKQKGKFPKHSVWLNFDDMDETIYRNAYPVLKKYKIPATGFVITGHIGEKNFHNLDMINYSQLKEMNRSGLWDFETHTNDMHSLKKGNKSKFLQSSNSAVTQDIKDSEDKLHSMFGKNQDAIAYPYGLIDKSKIKATKNAGMKYGFTLKEQAVSPKVNNYKIPRILVSNDAFDTLIKKWDGFNEEK